MVSHRLPTHHGQAELSLQREGQRIPNLTHPAVPIGGEELATILAMVGEQRRFEGFEPRDHVAVAESLDLVDFEAAAEVCESRAAQKT